MGFGDTRGYMLSSPAFAEDKWLNQYNNNNVVVGIRSADRLNAFEYRASGNGGERALRPVVCIPSNLLEYNSATSSWDINVTK